jgi:biopolymer transport protein TolQ
MDPTDVSTTELAGSVAAHDFSLWGLFMQADVIVKSVIFLLFMASFWCWKIIFDKWSQLQTVNRKASKFEEEFWQSDDLDAWFKKLKKLATHPLGRVFAAGMQEWNASKDTVRAADMEAKKNVRARVSQVMQVAKNRELDRMENDLTFLATTGSTATFVGLFGTVWGIMNSFQNIAAEKSTNLVVVAPGIAEALFATAIGLIAAIPAMVAYNRISRSIDVFSGRLDDFISEFDALLSRQLERKPEPRNTKAA